MIADRLAALGLTLPAVPAPVAAYVNCVRSGNLLFLSGGLPIDGEKKVIGKVPSQVSIEEAQGGARIIILNRLAVMRGRIERQRIAEHEIGRASCRERV